MEIIGISTQIEQAVNIDLGGIHNIRGALELELKNWYLGDAIAISTWQISLDRVRFMNIYSSQFTGKTRFASSTSCGASISIESEFKTTL
jgi:hypothetical protein